MGSVEVGKLADMVILNSDPTVDIRNSRDIAWVVKGGRAYRPHELMANQNNDSPEKWCGSRDSNWSTEKLDTTGNCDASEDQCDCVDDCGTPPDSESICDDGIDNDCDLLCGQLPQLAKTRLFLVAAHTSGPTIGSDSCLAG